ncbi:C2 calcium-dependent membrane targeting [Corchorus olitorius]|uniref:C2 calcium-dependent membrane targeting n=1 Tax=Corchorus olitorius TaxID=93759 RepID=A0A1R3HTA2_9ROSI|nr:C2 calcium-dependent membrane targeting [Corchorus olitorius]
MDLLGSSDPYVKLSLSGERLPAKKTSVKMRNLNPIWNEDFKLTVKDPQSQVLQLHVYDWEKVGTHDKLGMQVVPLRLLTPHETQEFALDLVKNTNPNDPHNKKQRGQLIVQMTFNPFKEDNERFSGPLDRYGSNGSGVGRLPIHDGSICGAGLLSVLIQRAEDVEGKHNNNPYAVIVFRGEKKKTKTIKKTRDPCWNEEFQFVLEEAPLKETMHIEVRSNYRRLCLRKESLGHVDINLHDVVYNGRIIDKYDLINSKNGVICIEIRWEVT